MPNVTTALRATTLGTAALVGQGAQTGQGYSQPPQSALDQTGL